MQEAREALHGAVLGQVLHQVDRLGDRDVDLAARQRVGGIDVFARFDQFELDAGLREPAEFLADQERHVVGIQEPLEAQAQPGHAPLFAERCGQRKRSAPLLPRAVPAAYAPRAPGRPPPVAPRPTPARR